MYTIIHEDRNCHNIFLLLILTKIRVYFLNISFAQCCYLCIQVAAHQMREALYYTSKHKKMNPFCLVNFQPKIHLNSMLVGKNIPAVFCVLVSNLQGTHSSGCVRCEQKQGCFFFFLIKQQKHWQNNYQTFLVRRDLTLRGELLHKEWITAATFVFFPYVFCLELGTTSAQHYGV